MCDYFVISTLTGKREIDSTFFSIFSFKEIFFFSTVTCLILAVLLFELVAISALIIKINRDPLLYCKQIFLLLELFCKSNATFYQMKRQKIDIVFIRVLSPLKNTSSSFLPSSPPPPPPLICKLSKPPFFRQSPPPLYIGFS